MITDFDKQAVEYGAMRVKVDYKGTEYLEVTLQKNPLWEDEWRGDKKYLEVKNKATTIHKWIPARMNNYLAKIQKEKEAKMANEMNWKGIEETAV